MAQIWMQILFKMAQFWMPFNTTVVGSDGSLFTSMGGSTSSDGSFRMGDFATGRGATFEDDDSKW